MLDRNGREIKVGHTLARPYPTPQTLEEIVSLPATVRNAVLGTVVEIVVVPYEEEELAHLGDGILYEGHQVITMGRLEWLTCPKCKIPWVFDVDMESEECPSCGVLLDLTEAIR